MSETLESRLAALELDVLRHVHDRGVLTRELRNLAEIVQRHNTFLTILRGETINHPQHLDLLLKQVRTLQDVTSSLQQDLATLEEKFHLMEESTGVVYAPWHYEADPEERDFLEMEPEDVIGY